MGNDWRNRFRSWSRQGSIAHPDSPAGGTGPGFSRPPGYLGDSPSWSRSPVPHPDSPEARHSSWSYELQRIERELKDRVHAAGNVVSGKAKSTLILILDQLPLKPDSAYSVALLRHYVEETGDPYDLGNVPKEWQDWIVKATKAKPGKHRDLNPYNSGIYDLRNSLGHFDVVITERKGSRLKSYEIQDRYEFGFIKNDRSQKGRHGFPLGDLSDSTLKVLRFMLPTEEHQNPGGFKERWEIKKIGKETILYIPQEVLASVSKPFEVRGKFER